jgi:hypothetical protein
MAVTFMAGIFANPAMNISRLNDVASFLFSILEETEYAQRCSPSPTGPRSD